MWTPQPGDIVQVVDDEKPIAVYGVVLAERNDGFVTVEVLYPHTQTGKQLPISQSVLRRRDDFVRMEYVMPTGEYRHQQLRQRAHLPKSDEEWQALTPERSVLIDHVAEETDSKGPIKRIYLRPTSSNTAL